MKTLEKNKGNTGKKNDTFLQKVLRFFKGAVIAVVAYLMLGVLFSDFIMNEDYYEYTKTTQELNDLLYELDDIKANGLEKRKAELEKELKEAKQAYEKALEESK